jgi:hypothetical protein
MESRIKKEQEQGVRTRRANRDKLMVSRSLVDHYLLKSDNGQKFAQELILVHFSRWAPRDQALWTFRTLCLLSSSIFSL